MIVGLTSVQKKLYNRLYAAKETFNRVKNPEKKQIHQDRLFKLEREWEEVVIAKRGKKKGKKIKKFERKMAKPIKRDKLVKCPYCSRDLKHNIEVEGAYVWLVLYCRKYIGNKRYFLESDVKEAFGVK
jgi:hypothetical protein